MTLESLRAGLVDRYRVERELGAGDMATVYLAHDLKPESRPVLKEIAATMQKYPDLRILIEGHTDNTGTDAVNQPLSERRAASVSQYLQAQGVPANRLTTRGYGSTQPKVPNDSPANLAMNRRVELGITANDEMVAQAKAGEIED